MKPPVHIHPMDIEKIIKTLVHQHPLHSWDQRDSAFLFSIADFIDNGNCLTTRQCHVVLKILRKFKKHASSCLGVSEKKFTEWLDNPSYAKSPRVTVIKRNEVRYVGDNVIAFSCSITNAVNQFKSRHTVEYIDGLMCLAVDAYNIDDIISFIGQNAFEMDDETEEFLALCLSSRFKDSVFVAHEDMIVCNICDNDLLANYVFHILGGQII